MPVFDIMYSKSAFYRALDFRAFSLTVPSAVREQAAISPAAFTERHLHCIWYDNSLRPSGLYTSTGEPVTVISPGRWNLEAGPDFLDAAISTGKDKSILTGDIEIHVSPKDWTSHGHGNDPAYSRVAAHVCLKKGDIPASLPQCAVQVALAPALEAEGPRHPEDIDIASYPYATPSLRNTKCSIPFRAMTYELQTDILSAAGQERLRVKSERMLRLIKEKGSEQTLYEEIMAALGYKHNRVPFRKLAAMVPVKKLRKAANGNANRAYALLMGAAGLLPHSLRSDADDASGKFLRELWDYWWRHASMLSDSTSAELQWHRAGVRPQNHPARRLAAAACIFTSGSPAKNIFEPLDNIPYYNNRLTLGGRPQQKTITLLGSDRKAAIITNILAPFMAASGENVEPVLDQLPPQSFNSLTKEMMNALTGGDYNAAKYRHALLQQGLIQVFSDYCLDPHNTCENCAFAQALQKVQ